MCLDHDLPSENVRLFYLLFPPSPSTPPPGFFKTPRPVLAFLLPPLLPQSLPASGYLGYFPKAGGSPPPPFRSRAEACACAGSGQAARAWRAWGRREVRGEREERREENSGKPGTTGRQKGARLGERGKREGWVRRRDSDPPRTPGGESWGSELELELKPKPGTGRRPPGPVSRARCIHGSSVSCSLLSQEPRAGVTVSVGLRDRQGWARESKACRASPAPHCGWLIARPFPAGARSLAPILSCLSPALRNAAPRLVHAPGARAGLWAGNRMGFGTGILAGAGAWV